MSQGVRLDVKGLDQLRRELKKLDTDGEWTDALKDVNKEVADLVVQRARLAAFTPLQRKAAESLKASRQLKRAQVTGGGARYPFFGGAEFGAGRGQRRVAPSGRVYTGFNQFKPWRGSGRDAGYFLYPAIRASEDAIVEMYLAAVDEITKQAFPD